MADIAFDAPRGRMPVLQFMAPSELAIDPSYQRSIEGEDSQRLIALIAREWNWDLCLPLVVSRRSDGGLFVIDGQHRLEAARKRGDIAHLPCVVGDYADAAAEAANFVTLNRRRRPLSALDIFRAAVASGDPKSVAIDHAIATAGLRLAPHMSAGWWEPGMVGNIGGIRQVWNASGGHIASEALEVLATAYAGQVLRYAGTIFPGIAAVCARECAGGATFDATRFARFTAALEKHGQGMLRREIVMKSADGTVSRNDAAILVVRRVYELSLDGKAPPATDEQPGAEPMHVSAGFGADNYDLRAKGGAEFCEQCDQLRKPDQVNACDSRWCSLRDAAA